MENNLPKFAKKPEEIPRKSQGWQLERIVPGFYGGYIAYAVSSKKSYKRLLREHGLKPPSLLWPPHLYVQEHWGLNPSRYWVEGLQLLAMEYINKCTKEILLDQSPFLLSVHTGYNNIAELCEPTGISSGLLNFEANSAEQRGRELIIINLFEQLFLTIWPLKGREGKYLVDSSFLKYTLTPKKEIVGEENLWRWLNSHRGALR